MHAGGMFAGRLCAVILTLGFGIPTVGPAQDRGAEPLRITSVTPSGEDVPAGRQIVFQFNRPVVPIGRMSRDAAEIPIEIEPALACQWRWIDPSALACQLGEDQSLAPATRYALTLRPGLRALDGATISAPLEHAFVTERPGVVYASFRTWRAPGLPVIRVIFSQPVARSSVADHMFIAESGNRRPLQIEPDEYDRELPRFLPAPGLVSADGPEPGAEQRTVVGFNTFSEYRLLGIVCNNKVGTQVTEQVVRMLHPRPRTVRARWLEGFEAARLQATFTKNEILGFYLNQVPHAANRRGVRQAADYYFSRDLDTLSRKVMLALAVLVRSPSRLDLYRSGEAVDATIRRRVHGGRQHSTREFSVPCRICSIGASPTRAKSGLNTAPSWWSTTARGRSWHGWSAGAGIRPDRAPTSMP